VIARLLHNLKEIFASSADWPRLLAVQERLVILLPDAPEERRDRGLAQAELGRADLAAGDVAAYLAARPEAADAAALRRQLGLWQRGGRPRLHR
jgi:regulator of sirC expression with transglutaminase-like and TPR domain